MSDHESKPSSPARLPAIGVCGLGQMGSSAAVLFARYGYRVLLWGRDASKLEECCPKLDAMSRFLDEHFGTVERLKSDVTPNIEMTAQLDDVTSQANFILECLSENRYTSCDRKDLFEPMRYE